MEGRTESHPELLPTLIPRQKSDIGSLANARRSGSNLYMTVVRERMQRYVQSSAHVWGSALLIENSSNLSEVHGPIRITFLPLTAILQT